MAILQGNTYLLPVQVSDCDGSVIHVAQVVKGEFTFGNITKIYGDGGDVTWNEELQSFIVPLTESETFGLNGIVKYQGRVLLKDGSVNGSVPASEYIYDSIGTTILSSSDEVGEKSGKILTINLLERVGGGGGTTDYNELENKPSISGVVVEGERSIEDYGGATKNYVDERFNGANKSVSFVNYSLMINSLNSLGNASYNVGQNIMIVTLNVPDLWVSEIAEDSVAYNYVSDDDFIGELKSNGSVQVGYYKLSALETQKVDLTEYVKNTDYATTDKGGVVKIGNTINGIAIDEVGTIYLQPASKGNIDKKTSYQPITPGRLDYAIKVGLTTNTETLTEEEKAAAQSWLGVTSGVSQEDFDKLLGGTTQIKFGSGFRAGNSAVRLGIGIGENSRTSYEADVSIGIGSGGDNGSGGKVCIGYNAKSNVNSSIQFGSGTNTKANTLQIFNDNIYNHNTHTLTVQNIELNGVDLGTQLGDLNTALETILGV